MRLAARLGHQGQPRQTGEIMWEFFAAHPNLQALAQASHQAALSASHNQIGLPPVHTGMLVLRDWKILSPLRTNREWTMLPNQHNSMPRHVGMPGYTNCRQS
jgi:hypothetical protein